MNAKLLTSLGERGGIRIVPQSHKRSGLSNTVVSVLHAAAHGRAGEMETRRTPRGWRWPERLGPWRSPTGRVTTPKRRGLSFGDGVVERGGVARTHTHTCTTHTHTHTRAHTSDIRPPNPSLLRARCEFLF
jgi:hypothetical protein